MVRVDTAVLVFVILWTASIFQSEGEPTRGAGVSVLTVLIHHITAIKNSHYWYVAFTQSRA